MKRKFIIPSVLLLAAIAPLPYGYYYILKFTVCITSIIEIIELKNIRCKNTKDIIVFTTLIILYNPIIVIPLGKVIWTIVNIVTIIIFIFHSQNKHNN